METPHSELTSTRIKAAIEELQSIDGQETSLQEGGELLRAMLHFQKQEYKRLEGYTQSPSFKIMVDLQTLYAVQEHQQEGKEFSCIEGLIKEKSKTLGISNYAECEAKIKVLEAQLLELHPDLNLEEIKIFYDPVRIAKTLLYIRDLLARFGVQLSPCNHPNSP